MVLSSLDQARGARPGEASRVDLNILPVLLDHHRYLIARRGLDHFEWPPDAADIAVIRVVDLRRNGPDECFVPALQPDEKA